MKNKVSKTIIYFFIFICLLAANNALCAEIKEFQMVLSADKELPLPASDDRVISGNSKLEKELEEKENELNNLFEKHMASLLPHHRVLFDESHLDWEECMRDEKRAFKPADRWTRANPKSEYENLYRLSLIKAVDFRRLQIENLRNKSIPEIDISKYEIEKKAINKDLEEFNYRVIVWTHEQLRYRVTRAMRTWNRYYESSMAFFQRLYPNDPEKVASLEMELLRFRHEYMKTLREALFRLKFEAEEN